MRFRQDRRAQAVGIAAWRAAVIEDGEAVTYGMVVRNGSDSVVYDVVVSSTNKAGNPNDDLRLVLLPPGTWFCEHQAHTDNPWGFAKDVTRIPHEVRPISKSRTLRANATRFRDASDVGWVRDAEGRLHESGPASS